MIVSAFINQTMSAGRNVFNICINKERPFTASMWTSLSFYFAIASSILLGILIQFIISRAYYTYDVDTGLSRIKNNYFSRQPRQQHLVRFPNDVSMFTSDTTENTEYEKSFESAKDMITSHEALDLATMQKSTRKIQLKSEQMKAEAQASYKLALEMIDHGKKEKARKLLQHAIYLTPMDPDILNAFGEFLMVTDVVLADHMFQQAIYISPTHTKALSNIQRTAPFVQEIDDSLYNKIDSKRDILVHVPENHPSLRRLKKELYYKHIYHTVAIEGNTMTLQQTRAIIETRVAIGGKSIIEHNEILGMDMALSYINSTLLNRIGRISLQDILEIHRRVLGFAMPIESGQLRNTQVYVGDYIPPRPGEVQALMEEFVEWLNSAETAELHPIKLAAIAHYKLVTIHPFYDGNGRTSRLLMNLILMHSGYPPVMIRVEQKHDYYKYLEIANKGDIRPFMRFIARCTESTVDEYLAVLSDGYTHDLAQFNYLDDGRTIILGDDNS